MGKYFTLSEMTNSVTAKANGIDNTPNAVQQKAIEELIENTLDPIREAWGKPIIVNSGFRSAALNKKVDGVTSSQHMKGEAADITTGNAADNKKLFDLIAQSGIPFDQLIDEKNYRWLHVSYSQAHNRFQILHLK